MSDKLTEIEERIWMVQQRSIGDQLGLVALLAPNDAEVKRRLEVIRDELYELAEQAGITLARSR